MLSTYKLYELDAAVSPCYTDMNV